MSQKEENLIRRAMKYDENALAALLKQYQEYLYKIAYIYHKNEQDALDAVSECVARVYTNLPRLKHPAYFKTWITRILLNEVLDQVKKKKRLLSYEQLVESGYEAVSYEDSISHEEKIDLFFAIEQLPSHYRKVLILKYFNELSLKEIAEIMEISIGNVKTLLYRGRNQLRKILEEMDYER